MGNQGRNRKKTAAWLGAAVAVAAGLAAWLLTRPPAAAFQRLPFVIVAGTPLRYDTSAYIWRAGEKSVHAGQQIAGGRGVIFLKDAALRLLPGRRGRTVVFFSYSVRSFTPGGVHITIGRGRREQKETLQEFEVKGKTSGYFAQVLPLNRDDAVWVRAAGSGVLVVGDAVVAEVTPPNRRQYVFVVAPDTFRGDRLGRRRGGVPLTPNLEAFSRDAVVFENAVAPSSWTLPSFMSFFTGLYEFHHQVTQSRPLAPGQPHLLAGLQPRFATVQFNDGGWLTHRMGFARHHDGFLTSSTNRDVYADRCLFDNARSLLEAAPLPALFLFLHTYKLHSPFEPGAEFLTALDPAPLKRSSGTYVNQAQFNSRVPEAERRAMEELYDAEVLQFDHFFGGFIQYLKRAGIYERSLIVLLSDHGEEFAEHGGWFHGHSLYSEIWHVPLLIKFPDREHAGRRRPEFVSLCDVLPTVMDYLKIPVPAGIDGASLLPLLESSRPERRLVFSSTVTSLFNRYLPPRFALFSDRRQLVYNSPLSAQAREFYREFGLPPARADIELYDLQADPGERADIAARQRERIAALQPEIARVFREIRRSRRGDAGTDLMSEEEKKALRSLGYL